VVRIPPIAPAEQAAFELAQMWFAAGEEKKGIGQLQFVVNRFPSGRLRPLALCCLGNRHLLSAFACQRRGRGTGP
jgi:hypothetical protein